MTPEFVERAVLGRWERRRRLPIFITVSRLFLDRYEERLSPVSRFRDKFLMEQGFQNLYLMRTDEDGRVYGGEQMLEGGRLLIPMVAVPCFDLHR